jgi:O-antigen ligase
MGRNKIISYSDFVMMVSSCLLIFCLPFAKAGAETFTWMAIFLWIFKRVLGYRAKGCYGIFPETELNKALVIFIAFNIVSVLFSVNLALSMRGFLGKTLKFIGIYFVVVEVINNNNRLRGLLISIIASVVLIIIDAGFQYFKGVDFLRGYVWMPLRASFSTRNGFSAWLIVIIFLLLGLLISKRNISVNRNINRALKSLLLILVVLSVLCLLATFVRGAWFAFLIAILLTVSFIFRKISLKNKLIYLSIGLSLLLIFLILPQPIKSKITTIGRINFKTSGTINARIKSTVSVTEPGVNIRLKLWKEAARIIKDYTFFGCGLNTYSIVAKRYRSFEGGGIYPHNSYLQMVAETGLFGLCAFLWVLLVFFNTGIRYLNKKEDYLVLGLLSSILAFLIHAFFDNHLYSLQLVVLFWFILGLTVAIIRIDQKELA